MYKITFANKDLLNMDRFRIADLDGNQFIDEH